jgi:large subunit ribosomal protein L10
MKRTDKEQFVSEFQDRVRNAPVLFLTDFSGLDVKSVTRLRHQLAETGAEYLVVKNRLVIRALREMDVEMPDLSEHLVGPTGVIIAGESPVEPAKALSDFASANADRPVFKVGIVERKVVEAAQFQKLAKLPPREVLLAQLAGALQAPMAAFVAALQGKLQETAGLVESLRQKRESEGK